MMMTMMKTVAVKEVAIKKVYMLTYCACLGLGHSKCTCGSGSFCMQEITIL